MYIIKREETNVNAKKGKDKWENMKKVADFLVDKRKLVLVVALLLTIISVVLMQKVNIITDMTEYLPDNSSMKQGMDIMETEFADIEISNTIRVMFTDMPQAEKEAIKERLEDIEYVDSVSFEADEENYNKDNHTLYILNIPYDYKTAEMNSVEEAVVNGFSDYNMVYSVDDTGTPEIPIAIMAFAVVMAVVILLIMCSSWVEPFLFLATIGIAVFINMGTNAFLNGVSETTYSIAAILQMALSMDYSIILINRYRQELRLDENRPEAMKRALTAAFSSITSSSVTTIVGLLVLCFMSFKIGADMGIVLAKGVLISLLCVFTVLPAFILIFDKWIHKTAKKEPHVPMRLVGVFSYKARYVVLAVFVVLFIGLMMSKSGTQIVYTMTSPNEIDAIFPKTNAVIMLYNNEDEEALTEIIPEIEKAEGVDTVMSYGNTLNKPYTAEELEDAIKDIGMGSDMEVDAETLKILYYDYYCGDNLPNITVNEFINFVADDVVNNELFADELGADIKDNIHTMKKMADANQLVKPMNAKEMADFFEMNEKDIKQLYLYYYTQKGGVNTGSMTLPVFVNFLVDEVASNPDYVSMFDASVMEQMETMKVFTNKEKMTTPVTYKENAKILGMDAQMVKMLYTYYQALSNDYVPEKMTFATFINYICDDAAKDPTMGAGFDEATLQQLQMIRQFVDVQTIQAPLTAEQLADAMGMDVNMVTQMFMMYYQGDAKDKTMSMVDFVNFLMTNVVPNPEYAASFDEATLTQLGMMQQFMNEAVEGKERSYEEIAQMLSMDSSQTKMLFVYKEADTKGDSWKFSPKTIIDFLIKNENQFGTMMGQAEVAQLRMLQKMINGSVNGTSYTSKELANLIGMDKAQLDQLYLLYTSEHGDTSGWKMSVQQFVDFIISDVATDEAMAENLDKDMIKELTTAKKIIDAVVSGKEYSAKQLSKLLDGMSEDLNAETMEFFYLYYGSVKESKPEWALTIEQLFDYLSKDILNDPKFEKVLEQEFKDSIKDADKELNDAKKQLQGKNHSLMMISTTLPDESEATTAFLADLENNCNEKLQNDYYLIGNSPMAYEMSKTFGEEMDKITLLTIVSIYIVVLLTFRSFIIPAILVLIIQSGVYATMVIMNLQGLSIYYLALLIVQSILMGSTIDYGILYTTYYCEKRKELGMKEAIIEAYNGSIHTILTSGLIMVVITAIMGYAFADPTIGQICHTISKGAAVAIILILFILPGVLAVFDKWICKNGKTES